MIVSEIYFKKTLFATSRLCVKKSITVSKPLLLFPLATDRFCFHKHKSAFALLSNRGLPIKINYFWFLFPSVRQREESFCSSLSFLNLLPCRRIPLRADRLSSHSIKFPNWTY